MKQKKLIPFEVAIGRVLRSVPQIGSERVGLFTAAGRILRQDVIADRDQPPFNRSAMDGYGCKLADFKAGVAELKVTRFIGAGDVYKGKLPKGEAVKIMTGAAVPLGVEMVVMVENSSEEGGVVRLREPKGKKWLNIHRQGSDAKKGKRLMKSGEVLNPTSIAVAASVGLDRPLVAKKIKVALFTSGNEVVDVDKKPSATQIRDANSAQLIARLSATVMVELVYAGRLRDEQAGMTKSLREAAKLADVVVINGGVSMGDTDYTHHALRELLVKEIFHKNAIKPGKPVWFGMKGKTVFFGLPGNPVSVAVTMFEFLLPALKKMSGAKQCKPEAVFLPLAASFKKKASLREFRIAALVDGGKAVAPMYGYTGSGDLVSAGKSHGMIIAPVGREMMEQGEVVEFHPWNY